MLEQITYPSGGYVAYTYNIHGDVETITAAAGVGQTEYVTSYTYNSRGLVATIVDMAGGITELEYDAVGRLIEKQLPGGITSSWTYDDRDNVELVEHRNAADAVIASRLYERGPLGEPTKITQEDGTYVEIDYDTAFRIDKETYRDAADQLVREIDYAYDADGRRTSVTTDGVAANYTWDGFELDAITGGVDLSFVHDDAGRVTSVNRAGTANDLNLAYDAFDQLTSITDGSSNPIIEVEHDALGRRTVVDGDSDKDVLVAPTLGQHESPILAVSPSDFAAFTYAGDMPLMRMTPNGPVYYLSDANGSIIGLGDGIGGVGLTDYDAFGNTLNQSGLMTNLPAFLDGDFGFHGGWVDPDTGLIQFRARTYDPVSGLFLSRDAGDVLESEIESFDPYQFNYDNPFAYHYASGHFTVGSLGVSMSISGNMRATKGAAVQEARRRIIEEVKSFVTEKVFDLVSQMIVDEVLARIKGAGFPPGQFEIEAANAVCRVLDNGLFHLEVPLDANGNPEGNGVKCPIRPTPTSLGGRRPDFIIGPNQPRTQLSSGADNWLVGDFKLTMAAARSQWRIGGPKHDQLKVFAKYAKNYTFVPAVGLITLWRGYSNGRAYLSALRQLRAAAKKHDVFLLYLVLVEGKASKTKSSSIVKRVFG